MPYGNHFWLCLRKQTEFFGFCWLHPGIGELRGEHLRTQVCCSSQSKVGLPEARPETGGQSSWGVSQGCMPPIAAANRPPENAPHTEASAYRVGSVVPDLSVGGSSVKACTPTCLHTDPLPPEIFATVAKTPQLKSSLEQYSWKALYILNATVNSLYKTLVWILHRVLWMEYLLA